MATPEEREAVCRGFRNRSAAAGSRNWSGVSASNRSVNAAELNRTNVNRLTATSTFPAAAIGAADLAVQAGAVSPPG